MVLPCGGALFRLVAEGDVVSFLARLAGDTALGLFAGLTGGDGRFPERSGAGDEGVAGGGGIGDGDDAETSTP
jgi:hypothetical protein